MIGLLAAAISAQAVPQVPSVGAMSRIEHLLKLPKSEWRLKDYRRFYYYPDADRGSRKHVYGYLTTTLDAGRFAIRESQIPDDPATDRGCTVVFISYDVKTDRIIQAVCDGVA